MVSFTVKRVVDGDTFSVVGGWEWKGRTGDFVRPTGYNTPENGESGYEAAAAKLRKLILGKQVQLGTPVDISYGRIVCPVYFNGKNLADYFSEYKC